MLWTIATLTIPGREEKLEALKKEVQRQVGACSSVEHLILHGPEKYGVKMRKASEHAKGQYISYVDDDDMIAEGYVHLILERLALLPDVVTFGSQTPGVPAIAWLRANREDNCEFEHEKYTIKTANHYCCWKRSLAMSSPWLPRNYGAEYLWYTALNLANPNLKEEFIPERLHLYHYDAANTKCQDRQSIGESLRDGGNRILLYKRNDGTCFAGRDTNSLQSPCGNLVSYDPETMTLLREVIFR